MKTETDRKRSVKPGDELLCVDTSKQRRRKGKHLSRIRDSPAWVGIVWATGSSVCELLLLGSLKLGSKLLKGTTLELGIRLRLTGGLSDGVE
jgi:hypothetical protein